MPAQESQIPLQPLETPSRGLSLLGSLRAALGSLTVQPRRAGLTLASTAVAVAALLVVLNLGEIAQQYIAVEWAHSGANLLEVDFVVPPGASKAEAINHSTLTVDDAAALARLPHVAAASPVVTGPFTAVVGGRSLDLAVGGAYPDIQSLFDLALQSGTFYTAADEASGARVAVVGPGVASDLFAGADPVGQALRLGSVNFRVVGVTARPPGVSEDPLGDWVYVPFSAYQQLAGNPPQEILLQADGRSSVSEVMAAATSTMSDRHRATPGSPADFVVSEDSASADPAVQQLQLAQTSTGVVGLVALALGALGIASTMLLAVRQRTREIGIRAALGARPADVQGQFVVEALAISLAGGILGILLGLAVTFAFSLAAMKFFGHALRDAVAAHPLPSPGYVALALLVAAVIGLAAGWLPARRAARLDPVEALRTS